MSLPPDYETTRRNDSANVPETPHKSGPKFEGSRFAELAPSQGVFVTLSYKEVPLVTLTLFEDQFKREVLFHKNGRSSLENPRSLTQPVRLREVRYGLIGGGVERGQTPKEAMETELRQELTELITRALEEKQSTWPADQLERVIKGLISALEYVGPVEEFRVGQDFEQEDGTSHVRGWFDLEQWHVDLENANLLLDDIFELLGTGILFELEHLAEDQRQLIRPYVQAVLGIQSANISKTLN